MRTGPVSRRRTGRQMPPGFQSGSRLSQCEKTPVIVRFFVRSRCGGERDLYREQVPVVGRRARLVGHLEGVREEVARGRADVSAVEPDVAVVEDAVEGEEAAVARRERRTLERAAVEQRAVARREVRGAAPVAGHRELGPVRVGDRRVGEPSGQLAARRVHPPRPREVTGRGECTGRGHDAEDMGRESRWWGLGTVRT